MTVGPQRHLTGLKGYVRWKKPSTPHSDQERELIQIDDRPSPLHFSLTQGTTSKSSRHHALTVRDNLQHPHVYRYRKQHRTAIALAT
jgi:hypothetical protein